jgi:transcriptional regulator with XRE-family HTH domain
VLTNVGPLLKAGRLARRWTLQELSARSGLAASRLTLLEQLRLTTLDDLEAAAAALEFEPLNEAIRQLRALTPR